MMQSSFIVRDDDLSYWTKPEEIDNVYKPLFEKKIKIAFAVIPFAVKMFNPGNFNTFYQDEKSSMSIGKNKDIVEYIREKIDDNLVEIMLHGYNHLYSFDCDGVIKVASEANLKIARESNKKVCFMGEYKYQDYDSLNKKTKEGKDYLEHLFQIQIKNFVPPSNQIGHDGVRAVVNNRLNISGLIGRQYDREKSLKGVLTYFDRVIFSVLNKGITYPKIADYGKHKELSGFAFTPSTNLNKYYNQLHYCKKNNFPFQIATHYWELNNQLQHKFYDFVDYLLKNGFKNKLLKEIL